MATVRMSEYLKHDIVQRFRSLWEKTTPYPKPETKDGDALYNTHIMPHMDKIESVISTCLGSIMPEDDNKGYKVTSNSNQMRALAPLDLKNASGEVIYEPDELVTISIPLSKERKFPILASRNSYYVDDPLFTFSRADQNFNNICVALETKREMQDGLERKVRKVRNLLENFTTLNQALKAWPAISKLVPEDKIAKVHEKQQRKRKEAQRKEMADEVVVDNDLNQTILTASLMGDN